jgi:hypothetical protein
MARKTMIRLQNGFSAHPRQMVRDIWRIADVPADAICALVVVYPDMTGCPAGRRGQGTTLGEGRAGATRCGLLENPYDFHAQAGRRKTHFDRICVVGALKTVNFAVDVVAVQNLRQTH